MEKEEILGGGYGERLDFWGEMGLKMEKEWIFFLFYFGGERGKWDLLLFLLMGKMDGRIERRGGFWLLKV